jgi:peptidoglycan hydrolase-like protein with peptidoglycan-binding domain
MAVPTYIVPGLVLSLSATFSGPVQDLQRDLRALGYFAGPIDGVYGKNTRTGIIALQHDLIKNTGASTENDGSAPVAIQSYNNGTVTAESGILDQGLAVCIVAMLNDANFPKVPISANPADDNQHALVAAQNAAAGKVPLPFLLQILSQESNQQHFQVPSASNLDSFVTIGLDHNNVGDQAAITSRGYGIGQFTLFHHPPTTSEVAGVISDALLNVAATITEFQGKFAQYVNGPVDTADDRIHEIGTGPLRLCKFAPGDSSFMNDCVNCCNAAGSFDVVAGATPVYAGAGMTYNVTQYHKGSYSNVPVRANIPCDWPYAIRRYNGSGVNSYDYQAEVLLRIIQ